MKVETKFAPGDEVMVVSQDTPEMVTVRKDTVAYITVDKAEGEVVVDYCLEWDHECYCEDELLRIDDYAALTDIIRRTL